MAGYLGLLVLVQSYTWLICTTRRLSDGTAVGLAGWVWGRSAGAGGVAALKASGAAVDSLLALEPSGHACHLADATAKPMM